MSASETVRHPVLLGTEYTAHIARENIMADYSNKSIEFEDVYTAKEAVDTTKPDEIALCRITKITNTTKGTESYTMGVDVYVDSETYTGWGKNKPRFNSPEQIDGLIEELEAMRDEWTVKCYSAIPGRASGAVQIVRKGTKRSAAAEKVKPVESAAIKSATAKRRGPKAS